MCLSDNNNNGCFQLVLMKQHRFPTTFPSSCDANLDQGDEDEKVINVINQPFTNMTDDEIGISYDDHG